MPRRPPRPALLAATLFVAVTVERLLLRNELDAAGFLYVIPIALLAAEYGVRAGAIAAAAASALTVLWTELHGVDLSAFGLANRMVAFAGVGVLVGWQQAQRRRLEHQREGLLAELAAMAMHDQLTGLPNRRAWELRIVEDLARAARDGRPLAVAAIDLDGLKRVNDRLGHEEGDAMLRTCAAAWRDAIRATDFLARCGGDEFLAAFPATDGADAVGLATRMVDALPEPYRCSIGVAVWDGSEDAARLVRRADQALYRVKRAGGGRIAVAAGSARPLAGVTVA